MTMIVDHPNYAGMPCTRDDEGKIDWIIPSNRAVGSKNWDGNARRREWWRDRAQQEGIPLEGPWISKTARSIHPLGKKPCQTCGRWMRLDYAYPTSRTLAAINSRLPPGSEVDTSALLDIFEIARAIHAEDPELALDVIGRAVPDVAGARTLAELEARLGLLTAAGSRRFSPGAMANPPDRLDGFHTYNLCCRGNQDTGRARANLATYGVDRRAYEQWCEGDWAAANALMARVGFGPCSVPTCHSGGGEVQLTADHVGPISLGFRHIPRFNVACRTCNSAKGNRMSMGDVRTLLVWEEEIGDSVVSWQARSLWDGTKTRVDSDGTALVLSRLMRINQHHYLSILGRVARLGAVDALLPLLATEQAANRYEFVDLDPLTLQFTEMRISARQDTYSRSMSARMTRIAFESVAGYSEQALRNVQSVPDALLVEATRRVDAAVDECLREPSVLRTELTGALADDGPGRDDAVAAALATPERNDALDRAQTVVLDAMRAYMEVVETYLLDRFDRGTHLRI